ncbi:GNAT family N-acetyltransferase [Emticicia sp. CRIBPO]|uniref:GNAT family N-acetyltransferase n=1 Tax=Emticicia sp. CRIBPO TaxID=2683258 RepID=UPI001412C28B|nr:GNAT family N-acetyltransferase [Emticicia sp. CRIBPO]NBA84531.1 GNAT family N-acetyltransferase [Emticicia sp. CRIBPO]
MSDFTIRKVSSGDYEAIYGLICDLEDTILDAETFRSIFEINISNPAYLYLLAEKGPEVIGMISLHCQLLLHHCGLVGEVQELIVKEKFRGMHIGEALLEEVVRFARQNNWLQLEVSSNKKRLRAHQFYLKNGFAQNHFKFVRIL